MNGDPATRLDPSKEGTSVDHAASTVSDWLKHAWRGTELALALRDIAGVVLWLAPGAGGLGLLAAVAALQWVLTPANAVLVGLAVIALVYAAALLTRMRLRRTSPVSIEPLTGPGPLRAGIRNLSGRPAAFYVKARLVGRRNDGGGQPLRTGSYLVPWEHSAGERVEIANGDAATIVVGRFQFWYQEALAQMDLPQLTSGGERSFESSRWNMGPREPLPEYDIELSVFAPSFPLPRVGRFILRPAKFTGPLELLPMAG